jgi:hypothetical protein
LARRLHGRYLATKSEPLSKRNRELEEGCFENEIDEMIELKPEDLKKRYYEREIKVSE